MTIRPILHHIPVCPFSQRLEILLDLKQVREQVEFREVDITRPRDEGLLRRTRGRTSLPVLELADGQLLRESLVILGYFDALFPDPPIARTDPWERAVEQLVCAQEGPLTQRGFALGMNQDPERRSALLDSLLATYRELDALLVEHAPRSPFLFERFGWAEVVFTPLFQRFWFLEHYEDFRLPAEPSYARVQEWVEACLRHPEAAQVSAEQVVKPYHDYAFGVGNGALPPGRLRSSFVLEPHWRDRPWPARGKQGPPATDADLGLL